MSFKDLENKSAPPHVDTPAEAEAREQARADVKAKADAKSAKAAARREGKPQPGAPNAGQASKETKGGPKT
jgi:hypothetical protein